MSTVIPQRRLFWLAAATLLLGLVTLAFFTLAPLYRATGPDLLHNAGFADGLSGWTVQGPRDEIQTGEGGIALVGGSTGSQVGVQQEIAVPAGTRVLQITGRAAGTDIAPGPKIWHSARVYAVPVAADGRRLWSRAKTPISLRQEEDWRSYDTVIKLPADASTVILGVQLAWTSGAFAVGDLSVVPAVPAAYVRPVELVLAGAWALVLATLAWSFWRALPTLGARLGIAGLFAAVSVGVLMPGRMKADLIALLLGPADPVTGRPAFGPLATVEPESLGHFLMFAAVTAVLQWLRVARPLAIALGMAAFGAVTEILQFFAVSRLPGIDDWLVDVAGIGAGWLVAAAVQAVWRGRRNRLPPNARWNGDRRRSRPLT